MLRRRTWVALAILAAVTAAGAARVALPEATAPAVEAVRRALRDVPDPVVLGVGLVVGTVVWLAFMWVLARVLYRLWRRIRGRVLWLAGTIWPSSPLVQFTAGVMTLIVVIVLITAVLPSLVSLGGTDGGPTDFAQDLSDRALNSEWGSIVEGDAVGGDPACRERAVGGPDSDGDGLPDRWERAGRTPGGASLPGADPAHKDLYVQLNHGTNVEPLTGEERAQLRRVWARMPVGNPDGRRGIDVHLVTGGPGGSLGEPAVFRTADGVDRYYTETRLGPRFCVYHQVTYGRVEMGDVVGRAAMPGYASVVDGRRRPDYAGNVSFRVAVTTHELLHNVAGRVDGQPHTSAGWLRGGPNNEFLSRATARDLNTTGLFGPV